MAIAFGSIGKRLSVGIAIPMALAFAGAAQAQNVPGVTYNPNSAVLTVPVTATVGGRCGFQTGQAPTGARNVGAVDSPTWTYDFPFVLECTGPSRIAVVSANGGMKTGIAVTEPGYLGLAPYDVAVNVTRTGGTTTGTCQAADLIASAATACALRGTASPTVGLSIPTPSYQLTGSYLRVTARTYTGTLVAGSYADTLEVTISPAS